MEIKHLSFSYKERSIYDDLNIKFRAGIPNIIIGPNGVGKTTLLDTLAHLNSPATYAALIDVPNANDVGYQLQRTFFYPTLTVKQTLTMYRKIDHAGGTAPTELMNKVYTAVLKPIETIKMGQLSGGERRIVLTYGTCLLERKMYLFDEPLSGVDPSNAALIMDIICSLAAEKQVVVTTHQLGQLKNKKAQIICVNQGKCVFNGTFSDLLELGKTKDIDEAYSKLINSTRGAINY
ncbi:ABC transporter ATP-binding protein [Liquorilactobacillus sucicola DSM 21376 = JCM 15457]|uniref:Abc-type cobalt transport system atpase component n=1 Tax=Liquorilactobacillus sucicola DSM 21376 = JCM 15457 TaxID=1423806 RepID=A0A023CUF9_9LACO|nr:AAA family ATPase [Liquorilactobacillus sucicola]KRN05460.1 abc-type cobalt transport system atpase component [Liquorilactobacillus sucicola DSM 21376 = JCM 15457]GAJ25538.1 ABC transporter ATP-binding protein [Liquorilactobacillus sucicola DSM 21376 = JCM 15457]